MIIPDGFQFSQASLQAYVDCPRLFELRYLLHLSWPEVEAGPALDRERRRAAGQTFHRLVFQETAGIEPAQLADLVTDADVARWWANYSAAPPPDLPEKRHAEVTLTSPLLSHRLVAKYDLAAVDPGVRAVIVDWKTYSRRPDRARLRARLQTRVYMFLLAQAGHEMNGGSPLRHDQIEMIYWFSDFARDPERFAYSRTDFEADRLYLHELIDRIEQHEATGFPKTDRTARCEYCQYGPLCDRGAGVGADEEEDSDAELDDEFELSFDFEQIAEIEY